MFGSKGLRRLPRIAAGVVLVAYWLTTITYVAPNNYLRAQFPGVFRAIEPVLYQKWEFFAPPPTFNTTVYAVAHLQNPEETITWDLTSEIRRLKGRHAPFNATEDAIDYVLSSAAIDIVSQMRQQIGNMRPAFSLMIELMRRRQTLGRPLDKRKPLPLDKLIRHRLPMKLNQLRLVIKQIQLRRRPRHMQKNHVLRLSREMRQLRRERIN